MLSPEEENEKYCNMEVDDDFPSMCSNELQDTVIFISNSELDGFMGGDGDLMDKLTLSLNKLGVCAIRVVKSIDNMPEERTKMYNEGKILSLADFGADKTATVGKLQDTFISMLQSEKFRDKKKIVYIGSRIGCFKEKEGSTVLKDSGSLFYKEFIKQLKGMGVGVVVCCLEFKFFKRSTRDLSRVYEQLRQQLFLADKIHFLTKADQEEFNNTMDYLGRCPSLQPLSIDSDDNSAISSGNNMHSSISKDFDLTDDIECLNLEEQKSKGVFASGVFTVAPLTKEFIMDFAKEKVFSDDYYLEVLKKREANVLHFGIMRGEKGMIDAIKLGKVFQELNQREKNKVIIAGRLVANLGVLESIIRELYSEVFKSKRECAEYFRSVVITVCKELGFAGTIASYNKHDLRNLAKVERLICEGNHNAFNLLRTKIFDIIAKDKGADWRDNIELHFNVSECKIRELAMRCKYAIKFDDKGMANNASTMVSCLGFYLPVFATCGLLTDPDFLNFELETGKIGHATYSGVVIMPRKEYTACEKARRFESNVAGEIIPKNPDMSVVANYILRGDKYYEERLRIIKQLHDDKVFDTDAVSSRLVDNVFRPLCVEKFSPNINDNVEREWANRLSPALSNI